VMYAFKPDDIALWPDSKSITPMSDSTNATDSLVCDTTGLNHLI